MKISRIIKITAAAAVLLLAAFLIPEYHPAPTGEGQISGSESSQQDSPTAMRSALAEIAAVTAQPQAQDHLALLTEPGDGMGAVRAAIATATRSLELVIYELEDSAIEQELAAAQARGVRVRVILQNVNSFGKHPNQPAFDFLKTHDVPVAWASSDFALTHQKTLIVDASSAIKTAAGADGWALIMTFNLTSHYYTSSRDFGLVDGDQQDVTAIETAFDDDWNGAQSGRGAAPAPTTASNGRDLVWSPGSASTLIALIDGASSTLDVYNEEMADPRVTAALEHAAARGVRVRIVMTYATNWKPAFNALTVTGVAVRTYASTAKLYIHAKMILADANASVARGFVGSENFSGPSLDANRELGILIARADILTSLERTFKNDWSAARPFTVKPG